MKARDTVPSDRSASASSHRELSPHRVQFSEADAAAGVRHAETAADEAAPTPSARSERELADFFENGPVPFLWLGADGAIIRANRAELELLGYAAEEYIGHNIAEFYVDQAVTAEMLERLSAGQTLRAYESRVRCKDGSIKTVRVDANASVEDGAFAHARCITRDVTDDRHEDAAARLATIVECSDDAIVGKTLQGVVTNWNRGAERIFGYTAAEMIGQPILRLVPPDRADEFPRIMATLQRGERVEHYETERVRKDGRRINVSITVSPIRDAAGRIIGASKIARDVTERRQAEAARARLLESERQARLAAEAAMRSKDEFLSVVSHELRTPLASILGWVNVLKSGATGDKATRAVQTIERSGRAQAKLIEDLLDVSRVITGQMRLDLRLVDVPRIIQQAVEAIRPAAEAKGVRLAVSLDPSTGPIVGDADRLQQIAWNLFSNAVKFTPAGGAVEVLLERRDDAARLTVRDTGRGIAPDFLPHIFERFRQAERADSRRSGGLGLGLAIVRHLTELHGGEVAACSDGEGLGATFTVTLPIGGGTDARPAAATARPLAGVRALVIDDDPDTRDGLRIVLEAHGAHVAVAGSTDEARALLDGTAPNVVISDLRLPGEDGYAFVRALRATDRYRSVPAIAMTGMDSTDGIEAAVAAGYDLRLGKPVEAATLVSALADLLSRSRVPS